MDKLALGTITANFVKVGAVAGTTNTFTTTAGTQAAIRGKFGTQLAVLTNSATTPTTDANTSAAFTAILPNKTAAVVFGINAAGTLVAAQGPIIDTFAGVTTTVGAFKEAPQFPVLPDDFCPFAYTLVRVAPSGGAGFVLGTTNWTASSMSCTTFRDVAVLPDRPQIV